MDNELLQHGLTMTGSAGNYAYMQIPADKLRHLVDSAFPSFAKNAIADCASGHAHRWVAGHDLLLDVPKTFVREGANEGLRHCGHILLTDFPTKSGIPIPGLSKSGLGEILVNQFHIPKAYLSINAVDGVVGIFACSEGFCDLMMVCAESARMTPQLFFDTFVEGCGELLLGVAAKNPLLVLAGSEQVLAGIVSSAYTISHPIWYVDPTVFFSSTLTSGILGFAISKFVFRRSSEESFKNGLRSCVVSGLFTIEAGFGIAALCGFVGMGLGRFLARRDDRRLIDSCMISREDLELIVEEYASSFPKMVPDCNCNDELPIKIELSKELTSSLLINDDAWGLQIRDCDENLIEFKCEESELWIALGLDKQPMLLT